MAEELIAKAFDAALAGDCIALERLLQQIQAENSIDLYTKNDFMERNLLHLAVQSSSKECVELLLSRNDIDLEARCAGGWTPFGLACYLEEPIEIVEILIGKSKSLLKTWSNDYISPLHVAVERDNIELVELLVANGANADALNDDGETPLHLAARKGNMEMLIHLLYVAGGSPKLCSVRKHTVMDVLMCGMSNFTSKVACFKVLFNFMYPHHEYRQKYLLADIFEASCFSYTSVSIIPYFVETAFVWINNQDKKMLARDLLMQSSSQSQLRRLTSNNNKHLFHMLALLLTYDESIDPILLKLQYFDMDYPRRLIRTEMMAFAVAAISDQESEVLLQRLLKYLDYVKMPAVPTFSRHVAEVLNLIKTNMIGCIIEHPVLENEFVRYRTITAKMIEISVFEADFLLLALTSHSAGDFSLQLNFFLPVLSYCTDLFMDQSRINARNLRNVLYVKLLTKYGTMELLQSNGRFNFEEFTLQRLTRDVIRQTVLSTIPRGTKKRDLIFVERLQRLTLPGIMIRYLRYDEN